MIPYFPELLLMGSLALGQPFVSTYLQLNSISEISFISFDAHTVEHICRVVNLQIQWSYLIKTCVFLLDDLFASKKQCETF